MLAVYVAALGRCVFGPATSATSSAGAVCSHFAARTSHSQFRALLLHIQLVFRACVLATQLAAPVYVLSYYALLLLLLLSLCALF
jgi:hypothetical protein